MLVAWVGLLERSSGIYLITTTAALTLGLTVIHLELELPVAGGAPGPHLGNIVAVGHSGGGRHDTADDPAMNGLYEHLLANRVKLAIRRGVLRFSLHVYNNEDDVDRVVQLAREWRLLSTS